MKKISTADFRVRPGKPVNLGKWATDIKPLYKSKAAGEKMLAEQVLTLSSLQNLLYASDQYSILLIFQAMDAAGKDSAIKNVMSGVNPQGCQVFSFKHPSAEELDHDFLWNATGKLPERGRIGIFNRSYYEDVLVVKVHPELLDGQPLPGKHRGDAFWTDRYEDINTFERHLVRNGTVILKFFLHVSKDEQRQRFLDRIDRPEKNWKFSMADLHERRYWDDYQRAYEEALSATSTEWAPWYVVPADQKWITRAVVADILTTTLESLGLKFPSLSKQQLEDLAEARKQLAHP